MSLTRCRRPCAGSYFRDGLAAVQQFGQYVQELTGRLATVRAEQEQDRRQLLDVRSMLQQSQHADTKEVSWRCCGERGHCTARVGEGTGRSLLLSVW